MGWTYLHRRKGERTEDILAQELRPYTLRAIRTIGGTSYCAIQDPADGHTFGAVVLTASAPSEHCNWGFKIVEESMGPFEDNCPAVILNLLSPTDSQYAMDWRVRCRAKANKRTPRPGDRVRFDEPVPFRAGWSAFEFTCVSIRPARYQTAMGQVVNIPPSYVQRHGYTIIEQGKPGA